MLTTRVDSSWRDLRWKANFQTLTQQRSDLSECQPPPRSRSHLHSTCGDSCELELLCLASRHNTFNDNDANSGASNHNDDIHFRSHNVNILFVIDNNYFEYQ
jgi:hypothetical protein